MLAVRITFGFMAVTGFLSMWLANIATTAMMIPIAAAVLKELDAHRKQLRELRRQGASAQKGELR
jgi:solute carrier family 13 (sodium-dependent dicarboxylate transporter), member 2/3/5